MHTSSVSNAQPPLTTDSPLFLRLLNNDPTAFPELAALAEGGCVEAKNALFHGARSSNVAVSANSLQTLRQLRQAETAAPAVQNGNRP